MYSLTDLCWFYTALWMILLIVSVILFICKIIFRRLGKTALTRKCSKILSICLLIAAVCVLLSVISLTGSMAEYFQRGH